MSIGQEHVKTRNFHQMSYSGEFRHVVQHFLLNDEDESFTHVRNALSRHRSWPRYSYGVLEMSIRQEVLKTRKYLHQMSYSGEFRHLTALSPERRRRKLYACQECSIKVRSRPRYSYGVLEMSIGKEVLKAKQFQISYSGEFRHSYSTFS